jgi:hypothetical protein
MVIFILSMNTDRLGSYFKKPNYDAAIVDFAEDVKQPFAVGEFLTFLDFATDAGNYTGPVLVSAILSLTVSAHFR